MSAQLKFGKGLGLFLGLFLTIIGGVSLFSGDGGAELNQIIGETYRGESNIYAYTALPLTIGFFTLKAVIKSKLEYLLVGIIGFVFILIGRVIHVIEGGYESEAIRPLILGGVYLLLYIITYKLLSSKQVDKKKDK